MRKILDTLYLTGGIIAAVSLTGIVVLVSAQIIARFFYTNIPSSDDISGYMVAWSTFMGLAYAMRKGDHIRVDLFLNMFPKFIQRWLGILVGILGVCLISVFFYFAFALVKEAYDYGDQTSGQIPMPLWVIQLPYVFGIFLLIISVLDHLIMELFFPESK